VGLLLLLLLLLLTEIELSLGDSTDKTRKHALERNNTKKHSSNNTKHNTNNTKHSTNNTKHNTSICWFSCTGISKMLGTTIKRVTQAHIRVRAGNSGELF
jgi:hypothetical protein